MEPVLGGDFYTLLKWNKRISQSASKFYAANVILAFEAIHSLGWIYRYLKPESLYVMYSYCLSIKTILDV